MNFRSLRIAAATCIILTGTLIPVTSSQAFIGGFVGYLGFDVDVGLDSATRDFLRSYPKEVREQAVIGATQIMDRADVSIALVFKQGRDLLLLGKDVVVCAGVTAESIPGGIFRRMFGIRRNYTEVLKEEMGKVASKATLNATPAVLYKRYVDVDNIGRDAYCLTLDGDLDQHGVLMLRAEIKTTALLWKRMEGLAPSKENPVGCTTVRECYALVSTTVGDSLGKALKQDKNQINADERMARIVSPPEPQVSWGSSSFDLRAYELAMLAMLSVHDDLLRVSLKRISRGAKERSRLMALVDRNESLLRSAEAERSKIAGCNQAYQMIPSFREATTQLDVASRYEVISPDDLAAIISRIQWLEERRSDLAAYKDERRGGVRNDGSSCFYIPEPIDRIRPEHL